MSVGHLDDAPASPAAQALFDEDVDELGFVMNVSRLWAHQPEAVIALFRLMGDVLSGQGFERRQVGVIVAASASTLGDSYCSLAWGTKLAAASTPELAAAVLTGVDTGLTEADRALARWVRQAVSAPNSTTAADVDRLRGAGWTDAQIFAATVYAALRLAFSTVNAGLGVGPDAEVRDRAPEPVRSAVTFGRPVLG